MDISLLDIFPFQKNYLPVSIAPLQSAGCLVKLWLTLSLRPQVEVPEEEVHKGETVAPVELNKKSRSKDNRTSVKIWTGAY